MLLVATMAATMFAGCGNDSGKKGSSGGAKEFDAFFAVPGSEINDDNEIQKIIEEKTGVRVKETWLTGQTADEAVGTMIAGGEYPDFIEGASGQKQLYEAGALVPLDDYIEKYPNIKNLFTELEWEKLRQDDGHIYWIPQFSCIKGDEKVCTHNDEAFWIQARVLKWANYPEIKTLDQYFDLIEKYNEANPTMADGTENIPYTILCEDWRYFCLENAPQFLDGYPNDGSCMVDPDTKKVLDYNTSDTAVKYFKKLNEEYQKGIVDPESFTQTYDEYISKLSTGRVLGMIDQWWDFAYTAGDAIKQARACTGAGEFLQCVAVLILEHFVLKEVRHACRCVIPLALKGERCVHRTEIGRQNGEGLAEALLGQIANAQTVCQRAGLHTLVQSGIILCHFAAPFIKNTVSSAVLCAAAMTCSRVMSATCSMRASGDTSVPAAACPIQ